MLKSNGLRHLKNPPVKFGFSSNSVPANIAKKLPPQHCSKPLLIPFFNFSHKRPTFAFTDESGYTLGFRRKIAHSGSHAETRGVLDGGWYHYPRSVLRGSETLWGRVSERQTLPLFGLGRVCSRRTQRAFGAAMRLCVSLSRGVAAPLGCVIFFSLLSKLWLVRPAFRAFRVYGAGVVSLPSACSACCRSSRHPLVKAANLPFSEVG